MSKSILKKRKLEAKEHSKNSDDDVGKESESNESEVESTEKVCLSFIIYDFKSFASSIAEADKFNENEAEDEESSSDAEGEDEEVSEGKLVSLVNKEGSDKESENKPATFADAMNLIMETQLGGDVQVKQNINDNA